MGGICRKSPAQRPPGLHLLKKARNAAGRVAMAGERRNFRNPRRFFSFTGGWVCGYGRKKEKFPESKKILLLHRRPGVWLWPEKGEISKSQEDSSLFRLHLFAAKAGERRNFRNPRRFFSFTGGRACGYGRRKEKFPSLKKILLLRRQPRLLPEPGDGTLSTLTPKFKQGIIEKSGRSRPIAAACESALHKQR